MVRDWIYVLEEGIISTMSDDRREENRGNVIEIMKDVDLFVISLNETMVRDSRGIGFDPLAIALNDEKWADKEDALCDELGTSPVRFTEEEKQYFLDSLIPKLEMLDL